MAAERSQQAGQREKKQLPREKRGKRKKWRFRWAVQVFFISIALSAVLSFCSNEALEEAEQGSAWLEDYLRLRPHIVYLEGGDGEAQRAMAQAGWACWSGSLDARDDGRSQSVQRSALLRELEGEQGLVRISRGRGGSQLTADGRRLYENGHIHSIK